MKAAIAIMGLIVLLALVTLPFVALVFGLFVLVSKSGWVKRLRGKRP